MQTLQQLLKDRSFRKFFGLFFSDKKVKKANLLLQKFALENKRFFLVLLLFTSFTTIFINTSKAADETVTCTSSGCTGSGLPLFNQTNVVPNQSISKTLKVVNSRGETLSLSLDADKTSGTDDLLLSKINVQIKDGSTTLYNNTLENLLNAGAVGLGSLGAGSDKEYEIVLTLQDVGNDYQGKTAKFNLAVQVTGEPDPVNPSNPTSTPTPTPTESNQALGETADVLGTFTLLQQKGSVLGIDTLEFATDEPDLFEAEQFSYTDNTFQSAFCQESAFAWWWPLVAQAVLSAIYLLWTVKRKVPKVRWLPFVLLAALSQIVHQIIGCNCATSEWCSRYWMINLLIFFVSMILYANLSRLWPKEAKTVKVKTKAKAQEA